MCSIEDRPYVKPRRTGNRSLYPGAVPLPAFPEATAVLSYVTVCFSFFTKSPAVFASLTDPGLWACVCTLSKRSPSLRLLP